MASCEAIVGGNVLKLEVVRNSEVTVVHCSGRIVCGDEVERLVGAVETLDSSVVVLDLEKVTAIDAAGIGALAELSRSAADQCRSLQLANPCNAVREVLEETKLTAVLPIIPAAVLHLYCVAAA